MSLTVTQLIRAALLKGGAVRKGEDPDEEELADALVALTIMLHSWAARKLLVRANTTESFPLVAGVGSYTIGVGGAFSTAKPFSITDGFIRDSNSMDTPLDIVSEDLYNSYQDKAVSQGRPIALFYDPGLSQQAAQRGTVHLYFIPDSSTAYTLYIVGTKPFMDFTAVTDVLTFDSPYEEAILYGLAIRLWREYHGPATPIPIDIYDLAQEAMRVVETMNSRPFTSGLDIPGMKGGQYNIYTGEYSE